MSWTGKLASQAALVGRSTSGRARLRPWEAREAAASLASGRRTREWGVVVSRSLGCTVARAPPSDSLRTPADCRNARAIQFGLDDPSRPAISRRSYARHRPSVHISCTNNNWSSCNEATSRCACTSPRRLSTEKNGTINNDKAASSTQNRNNPQNDVDLQRAAPRTDAPSQTTNQKPPEQSVHDISYLPPSLQPYARLARFDKPIGTFLLLHPCLWSTALAAPLGSLPDPYLCTLFGIGSFAMRGAGCTINDMWDSRYDREVERTRSRPLACGELTYPQAWRFLAVQLSAGLGVLVSLPHLEQCFWWGAASLPLVATYPLMKRYTNYPQLALGVTFNWGAIMGWVATNGVVDWSVVGPLYAGSVAWTLVYDTLYAHQDKRDDAKLGLKSTALTFGEQTKPILTALTAVTWGGWMTAGYNCGFGEILDAPYYYAGISAAAAHLLWQVQTADLNDAENLARRFRSNNAVGGMVLASCVAGNVMAAG